MSRPLLEISGLTKRFGALVANDAVDLVVEASETHAVIGPNGAGKTTLVALIMGELAPDAGSLHFDGQDLGHLPSHARAHLGIARSFQLTQVLPAFTALENVTLAVLTRLGRRLRFWRPTSGDRETRDRALAALDRVGLAGRGEIAAGALSHGEQRQLELAIALALEPKLLLLDEPLAGMGHEEALRIVELLASLRRDESLSILLVEHDMEAVFALAERVSVLVDGRVIASGLPEAVRRDPQVLAAYLGDEVGHG